MLRRLVVMLAAVVVFSTAFMAILAVAVAAAVVCGVMAAVTQVVLVMAVAVGTAVGLENRRLLLLGPGGLVAAVLGLVRRGVAGARRGFF